VAWSLDGGSSVYDCALCPDSERADRACPGGGEVPIAWGLNCTRAKVDLYACPRMYRDGNPWAVEMVRLARHYRDHHVLPEPGGLRQQDARTLEAIEACESFMGALASMERRQREAEMRAQAEAARSGRSMGEGINRAGELPPHLRR